ncbi:hypothetical protein HW555_011920 [Spodoptera exigua]|uniref:Uncharacterized protein n=1 Tax=Spodoptera exigua TaxID=7107 RepID=A0A835L450_SPOEX|nr:hypothetical protein HW555_011920 [Spodoptera exigua]
MSNELLSRASKREREGSTDEEETWTEVKEKKKSRYGSNNTIKEEMNNQVYISSKERLPKQFAMARILKENQFQKASELSVCYGLIKEVDLDLADDEILQNISCPAPAKLISLQRLNRRNRDEGGWCPSETLRLCFDGSHLPATVRVCDINVRVFPYIHQVSQCSKCWKLGHTRKMCASKNVICPKCGGHHENCDTTLFSCVNCTGDHISLSKACPVYKKERKLREIMAEFGCTYRKALEMYVPPEMPLPSENDQLLLTPKYGDTFRRRSTEPTPIQNIYPNLSSQPTYADTVKTKATIHEEKKAVKITSRPQKSEVKPKCQKKSNDEDWTFWNSDGGRKGLEDNMSSEEDDLQKEQCPSLKELWVRIKEVIYLKQLNLSSKIRSILQLCLEWFMLVSLVDNVKYLGLWLDRGLRWKKHVNEVCKRVLKLVNIFKVLVGPGWGVHPKHLRRLYISLIRSRIDFGSFLLGSGGMLLSGCEVHGVIREWPFDQ